MTTGQPARPLTPQEKAALWRDVSYLPRHEGPPVDDRREALYDGERG